MTAPSSPAGDVAKLVERITGYLTSGGLFNPELADHEAVRDLLIECRAGFESLSRDLADARARHTHSTDYSIDLQRIIEDLCHGRTIREPQTTARYHYDMAAAAKAAMESRARSVLSTQPKEAA